MQPPLYARGDGNAGFCRRVGRAGWLRGAFAEGFASPVSFSGSRFREKGSPLPSPHSDPTSSDGNEAAEGLPRAWRYAEERKYLALLSLFTVIPALLPQLSSAPSSGQLQHGRSTQHQSAETWDE